MPIVLSPSKRKRAENRAAVLRRFAELYPAQTDKTTAYGIIAGELGLNQRTVWEYLKQANAI
jgi:hypothetical protein